MLLPILTGLLMAVMTIAIHAVCTSGMIHLLRRQEKVLTTSFGDVKIYILTGLILLTIHMIECFVWAWPYMLVNKQFEQFPDAVYFSAVSFASLGYGDIVIDNQWRLLSAMQAMTGLLVFGWSTALLFAVVQRVWKSKNANTDESENRNEFIDAI